MVGTAVLDQQKAVFIVDAPEYHGAAGMLVKTFERITFGRFRERKHVADLIVDPPHVFRRYDQKRFPGFLPVQYGNYFPLKYPYGMIYAEYICP